LSDHSLMLMMMQ